MLIYGYGKMTAYQTHSNSLSTRKNVKMTQSTNILKHILTKRPPFTIHTKRNYEQFSISIGYFGIICALKRIVFVGLKYLQDLYVWTTYTFHVLRV